MQFLREVPVAPSSYTMMSPSQQERTESLVRAPMEEQASPPAQSRAAVATDSSPLPASSLGRAASSSANPIHPTAPLLELSISDAELDLLISSLTMPSPECDDSDGDDIADSKRAGADRSTGRRATTAGSSSEMQWVLSFLTDPNDAARHDAEAKSLLENVGKHDDDNYQYFLQELNHANLLITDNAASSELEKATGLSTVKQEDRDDVNAELTRANVHKSLDSDAAQALAHLRLRANDQEECRRAETLDDCDSAGDPADGDDDDEDEDWEIVRRSMKTQGTRPGASTVAATSLTSSLSGVSGQELRATDSRLRGDNDSPPPAPLRASSRLSRGGSENSEFVNSGNHSQKNHRVALSQEIGDLLKTHGEFQFPRHMFPHHNDTLELES